MHGDADKLVEAIVSRFGARILVCPDELVTAIVCGVPCIQDASEDDTRQLATNLHSAIIRRLDAQHAAENAEFMN